MKEFFRTYTVIFDTYHQKGDISFNKTLKKEGCQSRVVQNKNTISDGNIYSHLTDTKILNATLSNHSTQSKYDFQL